MSSSLDVAEDQTTTEANGHKLARHELLVDSAERHAALVELARQCDDFTVRIEHLAVGDYWIDRGIVVERKSYTDSRFHLQTDDCSLKPQSSRDVLIGLSFFWKGRGRYGCPSFIRTRSRAQWRR